LSVVAIGSFRGSPGATTLAVALGTAWAGQERRCLVVEADPDGGVLAARLDLGHHPCLTDLAVRARGSVEPGQIWNYTQARRAGPPVLVGHPSADQSLATLRTGATRLGELFIGLTGHEVIVDVGRVRPGSPTQPLLDAADLVVIVLRPHLEDVDGAASRLAALSASGRVGLVLAGERPYRADEVADALGVTVFGVVPRDDRGVRILVHGGRGAPRLPLFRSMGALARQFSALLDGARQP
jgi:MinD-like ATPase involved in chromosome partitioning or flagellar assembly